MLVGVPVSRGVVLVGVPVSRGVVCDLVTENVQQVGHIEV